MDSSAEQTAPPPPRRPLRVGWLAWPGVLRHLDAVLGTLAVGLKADELVEVVLFCPGPAGDAQAPAGAPVTLVDLPLPWWWTLARHAAAARMAEIVAAHDVCLLHALHAGACRLTARVAQAAEVPFIASVLRAGVEGRIKAVLRRAAAVLGADEAIRADLSARRACREEDLRVIPPAVHLAPQTRCFREPRYRVSLVAFGDFRDVGALSAVLRSFAEIEQRKYPCAYFLVGGGRGERKLRALADELHLRGVLQFVDAHTPRQLAEVLRDADVYIAAAGSRRVDMASLVAMSAGVPVIAADGVLGDFLVPGETSMRFEVGNAAELTMKLVSLLDDRRAARALADHALAALRHTRSPARMVASVAEVYRHVAARPD